MESDSDRLSELLEAAATQMESSTDGSERSFNTRRQREEEGEAMLRAETPGR